ncbi:MAG: hypothetical protein M3547_13410, partial [Acidobacteriota bacterium]|nr:hypothetical protein [Acidobacteriota bacterium]
LLEIGFAPRLHHDDVCATYYADGDARRTTLSKECLRERVRDAGNGGDRGQGLRAEGGGEGEGERD